MTAEMSLLRVVVRGPAVMAAEGTVGGVIYKREPAEKRGIYMTLRLPSWRSSLRYPQRDDERMKITTARLPFGKNVGVEFCGTDIDALCDAVAATTSDSQAVLALRPVLLYLQDNFSVP